MLKWHYSVTQTEPPRFKSLLVYSVPVAPIKTLRQLYLRERDMFYLMTHSTHFIYGYMASDIWLRTILIVRKETRCRHIGYSYRLTARVLLYASSHRQDDTYHGLCYTSRGALAGTRNGLIGPPWRIDPTIHRTMSEHSNHGATSRSLWLNKGWLQIKQTTIPLGHICAIKPLLRMPVC